MLEQQKLIKNNGKKRVEGYLGPLKSILKCVILLCSFYVLYLALSVIIYIIYIIELDGLNTKIYTMLYYRLMVEIRQMKRS